MTQYLLFLKEQQIGSWSEVDRFVVLDFLEALRQSGKSSATIIRMVSTLRKFHQFLRQEGLVEVDPM